MRLKETILFGSPGKEIEFFFSLSILFTLTTKPKIIIKPSMWLTSYTTLYKGA